MIKIPTGSASHSRTLNWLLIRWRKVKLSSFWYKLMILLWILDCNCKYELANYTYKRVLKHAKYLICRIPSELYLLLVCLMLYVWDTTRKFCGWLFSSVNKFVQNFSQILLCNLTVNIVLCIEANYKCYYYCKIQVILIKIFSMISYYWFARYFEHSGI